jgi:hypothetical protein
MQAALPRKEAFAVFEFRASLQAWFLVIAFIQVTLLRYFFSQPSVCCIDLETYITPVDAKLENLEYYELIYI